MEALTLLWTQSAVRMDDANPAAARASQGAVQLGHFTEWQQQQQPHPRCPGTAG